VNLIVEAGGLEKCFGSFCAVNQISFSVREGEVFGFLGPNGAGKTTTMKMIQCVSPRSGGELKVFGFDPSIRPREIKGRLGVVPQETNLDPDFTTYQNLLVYSRFFGIPEAVAKERIESLLEFVALAEKHDTMIDKLSGGMKRRLVLARALVNEPKLLILDEPTIGLDPQARHLIWERLRLLQSQGNTIILTTHYLEEASRLCDRIVIMDGGKILVEGAPDALVREHAGIEVVEADRSDDVIRCLDRLGVTYEATGDTVQVFTDDARAVAQQILSECTPGKVLARPATLEDVFLKLTGRALREGS
jgi:lipooligosaccharide transport system ATP-binding protein